ncbi:MAG: hypothetical protein HW374_2072 [Bacteroidetes bacterium]|nr:hypothetical protein [Bacteroidota bacterium]
MNPQHVHWLGHASFRIEDGATQIYIDPWKLPANTPKADVIFITHAHYDHFSPEDIAKIKKESTAFFAPKDVGYQLDGNVISVVPGQSFNLGSLRVKTVHAYNLGKQFHPKQNNWVGYLITLSTGQKIYHSGDTDFTFRPPAMRRHLYHEWERSRRSGKRVQTADAHSHALGRYRRNEDGC